jgi:glutamine amidotransferase
VCRHLAWIGTPRTLAALTSQRPYSLLRQSWSPRRMAHGTINADGFGVGWYAPRVRATPARLRRAVPMWTDASYASMAGVIASGCVLAAVRGASLGMPVEETATAPFTDGNLLLSHNGRVDPAAARALLRDRPEAPAPDSTCDSALVAALVFERAGKSPLDDAVAEVVTSLGDAALAGRPGALTPWAGDWTGGHEPARAAGSARLNLLVTDGNQVVATAWGDTLAYRIEPDGVLVASEPDDDEPGWVDVPDHHLLVADTHKVTLRSLIP